MGANFFLYLFPPSFMHLAAALWPFRSGAGCAAGIMLPCSPTLSRYDTYLFAIASRFYIFLDFNTTEDNLFKNIHNSMVTCGHVCDVDGDETVDDVEMMKSWWRWKKMHYDDLPIYGCQERLLPRQTRACPPFLLLCPLSARISTFGSESGILLRLRLG